MSITRKSRVGTIDFFKFIFAIVIALYHGGTFFNTDSSTICKCGYIAVEFYFIVSGYLLCAKAVKDHGKLVWDADLAMIRGKILGILPYILLACIASDVVYHIGRFNVNSFGKMMVLSVPDMLGLQMAGFGGFWATGVAWYLSSLFIVSFVIYPVLVMKRDMFVKYIAPISAVVCLGYIAHTAGYLDVAGSWIGMGLCDGGILRGYADICLGCMAYGITEKIDKSTENGKVDGTRLERKNLGNTKLDNAWLWGMMEVTGYVAALLYACLHQTKNYDDFYVIPFIVLSVSISFSSRSVLALIFKSGFWNLLGSFSMSIYLNHFFLKANMQRIFPDMGRGEMLVVYLMVIFGLSIANYAIGKWLSRYMKRITVSVIIAAIYMGIGLLLMII